jgi:single-strand DNA-binding protein
MSQEAFATVAGYATADPMFRVTKSGAEVAHIRVACTPRRVDRDGEWQDGQTSYFSVTCWRKLAVAVKASVRKGDPVLVRGRMRTRTWQTEERAVSEVEIDADAMGHDLTRGWASFHREPRAPADVDAGLRSGELARQPQGDGTDPEEAYAASNPEDPDEGDSASVPADADPRRPLAPATAADGGDILTEQAMAGLDESEDLDELDEVPVPA